jgi:hypothetical protein
MIKKHNELEEKKKIRLCLLNIPNSSQNTKTQLSHNRFQCKTRLLEEKKIHNFLYKY